MMSLLAGVFAGVGMFLGGLFGAHSLADLQASTTPMVHMDHATSTVSDMHKAPPAILGMVTAISGTTITVSVVEHKSKSATSTVFYTVDASSAKFIKLQSGANAHATSTSLTISSVSVGDRILASGTITGTTVVAKTILEGVPDHTQDMVPPMHSDADVGKTGTSTPHRYGPPMHPEGAGSSTPSL